MPPAKGDADEVPFRLLGPLELVVGGRAVALGGVKARALLAHLLLNANRLVPAEQLVEVLWPEGAPASAGANLQTYVWRLRKRLPARLGGPRLLTRGGGYLLSVGEGESDLAVAADLVADAARSRDAGADGAALAKLVRAESWWRGEPLADLPDVAAWQPELGRIAEVRLAAVEERLALQVRLGRHDAAAAELRMLLARHPYRERLWQQLMLALDRAGRRADALAAYADARERLVGELGVEPGAELRAAQLAILSGDAEADPPEEATEPAAPLCQLPAGAADFTGRSAEVTRLRALLSGPSGPGTPSIAVVAGAPGTGKTTVALQVAHLLREEFPDGQLYADLTGTAAAPRDPAVVLGDFLHALGVTGAALPPGIDARSALFRSRLADRRVLILLDDAASGAQVRSLLPAGGRCAVLVTGRRRLPELPGARHLELAAYDSAEAVELLARIAGARRVAAEPAEAAAIVESCGYVPLAIRIAGARLAGRRAWPLRELRERLADGAGRLSELQIGELGVRSSFELSLHQLPDTAARAFGLLALLGSQEFPGWVVDALLGDTGAPETLDTLVDANLVDLAGTDANGQPRYRMHELLRCYAGEVLAAGTPVVERHAALDRVLSGWLALATRAAAALPVAFGAYAGHDARWRLRAATADRLVAEPLRWFAAERRSLLAAVELAADAGLAGIAWRLSAVCVPFFDLRSHYEDWRVGHERALTAARAAGDRAGEAALLRGLGQVHLYRDEYEQAEREMAAARSAYAELGDRRGEAVALAGLGTAARVRRRPTQALRHYRRSYAAFVAIGDSAGETQLRASLGITCALLGDSPAALSWLSGALAMARELGDPHREAKVLTELGELHRSAGSVGSALDCLGQALAILRDLRDERCTAYALLGIGRTMIAAGQPDYAHASLGQALAVFRRTGNRHGVAGALELLAGAGAHPPAGTTARRMAPPA